jgi:hypothetical protein
LPKSLPSTAQSLRVDLRKDTILLGNICHSSPVFKDAIHFFKRLSISLRHIEPDPDKGQKTEDSKEDIGAEACFADKRWRNEPNDEVIDPV